MNPTDLDNKRHHDLKTQEHQKLTSALILAGFELKKEWTLENGYWPDGYRKEYYYTPWYLFQTQIGLIKIGWRKRVINIDWSATDLRKIITEDDVTKEDTMVHAWTYAKAVTYLTDLYQFAENSRIATIRETRDAVRELAEGVQPCQQ